VSLESDKPCLSGQSLYQGRMLPVCEFSWLPLTQCQCFDIVVQQCKGHSTVKDPQELFPTLFGGPAWPAVSLAKKTVIRIKLVILVPTSSLDFVCFSI